MKIGKLGANPTSPPSSNQASVSASAKWDNSLYLPILGCHEDQIRHKDTGGSQALGWGGGRLGPIRSSWGQEGHSRSRHLCHLVHGQHKPCLPRCHGGKKAVSRGSYRWRCL